MLSAVQVICDILWQCFSTFLRWRHTFIERNIGDTHKSGCNILHIQLYETYFIWPVLSWNLNKTCHAWPKSNIWRHIWKKPVTHKCVATSCLRKKGTLLHIHLRVLSKLGLKSVKKMATWREEGSKKEKKTCHILFEWPW
jgi:hypothetical protein